MKEATQRDTANADPFLDDLLRQEGAFVLLYVVRRLAEEHAQEHAQAGRDPSTAPVGLTAGAVSL